MLKTVSSITNAIGALNYKGTWDASTNSPALASGVGTKGDYYVVSVSGTTTLDGISNWGVGDWAAFNGSTWQRVEGGADLNGVNLSVSGTSTLSGLTASTALALNASKQVVSVANTGTGNNVLATSPALTTPNIGDATGTKLNIDNVQIDGNIINATNTNGGIDINANGTGRVNVASAEVKGGSFNVSAGATVTVTIAGVIYGQLLIGFGAYASAGQGYLHRLIAIGGYQAAGVAFYDVTTLASASHANTVLGAVTKGASSVTFTIQNNGSTTLQCGYHYTYGGQANNVVITVA